MCATKQQNKFLKELPEVLKWLIFQKKEKDYEKTWGLMFARLIVAIIVIPICIKFIPFEDLYKQWLGIILILFICYILISLYWEWIKAIWKFLKEDTIVHYIFLILIPIGIIIGGYHLFLGDLPIPFLGINVNANSLDENHLTVVKLNGFYASLFTAIAVIGAIVALSGWRTVKESKEQTKKLKTVEKVTEFTHKRKQYIEWIQEKFKGLSSKNIDEIDLSDYDDKKRLNDIKEYVEKDIHDNSWLEFFCAYNLITKKNNGKEEQQKSLNKAESIMNYLEIRVIKDKTSSDWQYHHIRGQLYTQKYLTIVKSINFFKSTDPRLKIKDDLTDECKEAISCLYRAFKAYNTIYSQNKDYREANNTDESLGNLALILIELYKFEKANNLDLESRETFTEIKSKLKTDSFLKKANFIIEKEIEKTSFNQYWDLARCKYYLDVDVFSKEDSSRWNTKDEKEFITNMKNTFSKEYGNLFFEQIIKEQKEFEGHGFPGSSELVNDLIIVLKKIK